MKQEVTVLIVDDHPLLRHGLRDVIGHNSRFKIVGEASDPVSMAWKRFGRFDNCRSRLR